MGIDEKMFYGSHTIAEECCIEGCYTNHVVDEVITLQQGDVLHLQTMGADRFSGTLNGNGPKRYISFHRSQLTKILTHPK